MIYRFRDTLNASINFFSMMASVEMFRAAFPQKINEDAKKRLMAYLLAAELDTEVRSTSFYAANPSMEHPAGGMSLKTLQDIQSLPGYYNKLRCLVGIHGCIDA